MPLKKNDKQMSRFAPYRGCPAGRRISRKASENASSQFSVEQLEARQMLTAIPMLSEFMADNDENVGFPESVVYQEAPSRRNVGVLNYPFREGANPDWLEIVNTGDEARERGQWASWWRRPSRPAARASAMPNAEA